MAETNASHWINNFFCQLSLLARWVFLLLSSVLSALGKKSAACIRIVKAVWAARNGQTITNTVNKHMAQSPQGVTLRQLRKKFL